MNTQLDNCTDMELHRRVRAWFTHVGARMTRLLLACANSCCIFAKHKMNRISFNILPKACGDAETILCSFCGSSSARTSNNETCVLLTLGRATRLAKARERETWQHTTPSTTSIWLGCGINNNLLEGRWPTCRTDRQSRTSSGQ